MIYFWFEYTGYSANVYNFTCMDYSSVKCYIITLLVARVLQ